MDFWSTVMAVASRGGGALLPRTFDILPAVGGITTWNLDTMGPCTLVPSDSPYVFTPHAGFSGQFELWGGGGGSGGVGAAAATTGSNSTTATALKDPSTANLLVANVGTGSAGATTNGAGNGRVGGTATGGDTNTTGGSGTNGTIAATCIAGNGGAAPSGGAASTGGSAGSGVNVAGVAGNPPGGGAAGAAHGDATGANRRATGGAGSGGYCKKAYTVGVLAVEGAHTVIIGAGGLAGTGDEANGAAGGVGRVVIT